MADTENMIERVGRALAKQEGYAYEPYPYNDRARAAIKAMREPTVHMCNHVSIDINAASVWGVMCLAALNEPETKPT